MHEVYSLSAIDLFASALGAFILLVMLLFPYYRHAGPDDSYDRTRHVMEQRRLVSAELDTLQARQDRLQQELDEAQQDNDTSEAQLDSLREPGQPVEENAPEEDRQPGEQ